MDRRLLGVVLCGGASRRMGVDKAALMHPDGRTFLQFAIQRLRPVCTKILLSGRTLDNGEQDPDVDCITDLVPLAGPMSGIIQALEYPAAVDTEGILVTPVDMPRLSDQVLIELRNRWLEHCSRPLVAISDGEQIEPLVAVYPLAALDSLKASFEQNDRSLTRWLETNTHDTYKISAASATNVNSPDDYKSL